MKYSKKEGIKTIIFDVGGVLALPIEPIKRKRGRIVSGVHSSVAKKLGISIDQYLDSIDTDYAKSIEGKKSEKEVVRTASRNLKISESKLKNLYLSVYKKKFKQNLELFRYAKKLKKRGYKIAVLTDQWPLSKKGIMPDKLYEKFDEVLISYKVKIRKPNPKIYRLALKKLKTKPPQALFIDNQEWNIASAKKLGIKTILFRNNRQAIKEIEKILKISL